jgi:hypothetical protein
MVGGARRRGPPLDASVKLKVSLRGPFGGRGNLIHPVLDCFVAALVAITQETQLTIRYSPQDYNHISSKVKPPRYDYL